MNLNYIKAGIITVASIVRGSLFGYRAPLLVCLLVTNRCNLDCIYCFSNAHKKENADIPLEKLFTLVDQLKEAKTLMISICGGEPTLRKDLGQIIDYIKSKGIMVELVTNGFRFENLLDHAKHIDFLAISVDGARDAHDGNRGKGSYDVAIKALEMALANGITTRIHGCFTRKTAHALPQLMEISQAYGVRINVTIPSVHTSDPTLSFEDNEIREYYNQMAEYKKRGYLISNAWSTLDWLRKWPGPFNYIANKPHPDLPYLRCKRKDFSMYIDATGDAYPCAAVWGKHKFNVFDTSVRKAFEAFDQVPCTTCINEAEFHLLFRGSVNSIINVAAFGVLDRMKRLWKW